MIEIIEEIIRQLKEGITLLESKDLSSASNILRNRLAAYEEELSEVRE